MPYKITVNNRYSDGSELKFQFDTNSGLLHDASKDAENEMFMARWHQIKAFPDKPIFSQITYKPV